MAQRRYINGRMVTIRDTNTEAVLETIRPKPQRRYHRGQLLDSLDELGVPGRIDWEQFTTEQLEQLLAWGRAIRLKTRLAAR